jgi:hypothetical protein|tara:strand:- start:2291 stop:2683 length:393 start_codon:yes stop_codon:yes gene_type:complete
MRFEDLNKDNFLLFAIRNYDNPHAVTKDDFVRDLNHFKYLKRLLRKYHLTGELKSHLLINHFIVLYNIFGDAATPMLFYKIEQELWGIMKSFLIFLNKFPDYPKTSIHDIKVDMECFKSLQEEYNGKRKN